MPLVSVCAMSMPHVKTPTLALLALWTVPVEKRSLCQAGVHERNGEEQQLTFRLTTEDHTADDPALTESASHNLDHPHAVDIELCVCLCQEDLGPVVPHRGHTNFGLLGMTAMTASATRLDRRSSVPYCFAARVGRRATLRLSSVKGVSSVRTVSSAQCLSCQRLMCRCMRRGERKNALSSSSMALSRASS